MNGIIFLFVGGLVIVAVLLAGQGMTQDEPEFKFSKPTEVEGIDMQVETHNADYAMNDSGEISASNTSSIPDMGFAPADRVGDKWIIVGDLARRGLTTSDEVIKELVEDKWIDSNTMLMELPENCIKNHVRGTGSMQPTVYVNHTVIECPIELEKDLYVGDIIIFDPEDERDYDIIHRIIEIGEDEKGWYCITKGDHNDFIDGKVRFSQIKYVVVGIFY